MNREISFNSSSGSSKLPKYAEGQTPSNSTSHHSRDSPRSSGHNSPPSRVYGHTKLPSSSDSSYYNRDDQGRSVEVSNWAPARSTPNGTSGSYYSSRSPSSWNSPNNSQSGSGSQSTRIPSKRGETSGRDYSYPSSRPTPPYRTETSENSSSDRSRAPKSSSSQSNGGSQRTVTIQSPTPKATSSDDFSGSPRSSIDSRGSYSPRHFGSTPSNAVEGNNTSSNSNTSPTSTTALHNQYENDFPKGGRVSGVAPTASPTLLSHAPHLQPSSTKGVSSPQPLTSSPLNHLSPSPAPVRLSNEPLESSRATGTPTNGQFPNRTRITPSSASSRSSPVPNPTSSLQRPNGVSNPPVRAPTAAERTQQTSYTNSVVSPVPVMSIGSSPIQSGKSTPLTNGAVGGSSVNSPSNEISVEHDSDSEMQPSDSVRNSHDFVERAIHSLLEEDSVSEVMPATETRAKHILKKAKELAKHLPKTLLTGFAPRSAAPTLSGTPLAPSVPSTLLNNQDTAISTISETNPSNSASLAPLPNVINSNVIDNGNASLLTPPLTSLTTLRQSNASLLPAGPKVIATKVDCSLTKIYEKKKAGLLELMKSHADVTAVEATLQTQDPINGKTQENGSSSVSLSDMANLIRQFYATFSASLTPNIATPVKLNAAKDGVNVGVAPVKSHIAISGLPKRKFQLLKKLLRAFNPCSEITASDLQRATIFLVDPQRSFDWDQYVAILHNIAVASSDWADLSIETNSMLPIDSFLIPQAKLPHFEQSMLHGRILFLWHPPQAIQPHRVSKAAEDRIRTLISFVCSYLSLPCRTWASTLDSFDPQLIPNHILLAPDWYSSSELRFQAPTNRFSSIWSYSLSLTYFSTCTAPPPQPVHNL